MSAVAASLAAGEVRVRPFHENRAIILLASVLLHVAVVALLLLIHLPEAARLKPPVPISITYVEAQPPQPAQPPTPVPAPRPLPAVVPRPAPVTAPEPSEADRETTMADAQAFAAMMQQATQTHPMTVVTPKPAPAAPAPDPVVHVEGPAPAAVSQGSENGDDAGVQGGNSSPRGFPPVAGNGAGAAGDGSGTIGTGGGGSFAEYVIVNVDGSFRSRADPQLKQFTQGLVDCGLRAIDSDNHNWMVELQVTFMPDGAITDIRPRAPALPSTEQAVATRELMRVLQTPGCARLAPSIFVQHGWHTGEIYLFPLDNPNVPFNLKPQSMTPFSAPDLRLTPR